MDIRIDPLEMESILHITRPLEQSLGLCNDYFSYAKEKEELRQGKGRNAVTFLMQKEGMTEEEALKCLKDNIASLEETHNAAFEDSMKNDVLSPELRRYILFLRTAGGGMHVFHSTAGRYEPSTDMKADSDRVFIRHSLSLAFVSVALLLFLLAFKIE
jgi:hypothetical protein